MMEAVPLSPSSSSSDLDNSCSLSEMSPSQHDERQSNHPAAAPPPIATVHAIHPQFVVNKLRPLKDEVVHRRSFTQLSLCVNDSASGKTFDQVYTIQECIGEGGFARVYRCQHKKNHQTYAVKHVFEEEYEASGENIKEEIEALKRLRDGPYVVRFMDVFVDAESTYLIMEECKGGDLLQKLEEIEAFPPKQARKIARTLLEAIGYCHRKQIAHRDIKLENILLMSADSNVHVKLADFGCARDLSIQPDGSQPVCRTLVGSPQYVAPELYTHEDGYDERCDLWSAGVVIYILLSGYAPFEAPDCDLPDQICQGYFSFHEKYWKDISQAPKDLITGLLQVDVDKRFTVSQALDSAWLQRSDRQKLAWILQEEQAESLHASSSSIFAAWQKLRHKHQYDPKWAEESFSGNTATTAASTSTLHESFLSLSMSPRTSTSARISPQNSPAGSP